MQNSTRGANKKVNRQVIHALRNHLSAALGWIELGEPEKAKAAIRDAAEALKTVHSGCQDCDKVKLPERKHPGK